MVNYSLEQRQTLICSLLIFSLMVPLNTPPPWEETPEFTASISAVMKSGLDFTSCPLVDDILDLRLLRGAFARLFGGRRGVGCGLGFHPHLRANLLVRVALLWGCKTTRKTWTQTGLSLLIGANPICLHDFRQIAWHSSRVCDIRWTQWTKLMRKLWELNFCQGQL